MKFADWFKPGTKVKWWITLGALGILMTIFSIAELISQGFSNSYYWVMYCVLALTGVSILIFSFRRGKRSVALFMNDAGLNSLMDFGRLSRLVYDKRLLIRGPKIVVIGGGTGLSTMLRGLKQYTSNITAIVTVADDGGGSGVLREELGMLPPGDIRNCILSLANTEPVMEELLQYRFSDGMLKGQSFGNLFLAAMNGISDNFEEAIKKMSDVLAVTGRVLPVTLADIKLFAELENGVVIEGESKISKRDKYKEVPIKRVFIEPSDAEPLNDALMAIDEADAVILGPGSLYTSIIPNLLMGDIVRHIEDSKAIKIYVSNIMTQPGETTGFSVCDHIDGIQKYCSKKIIDYVIVNNGEVPEWLYGKYIEDGAEVVKVDRERIKERNIRMIDEDLIYINKNLIRHNTKKLAHIIMDLILDKALSRDKKRSIETYYLGERLKEIGR